VLRAFPLLALTAFKQTPLVALVPASRRTGKRLFGITTPRPPLGTLQARPASPIPIIESLSRLRSHTGYLPFSTSRASLSRQQRAAYLSFDRRTVGEILSLQSSSRQSLYEVSFFSEPNSAEAADVPASLNVQPLPPNFKALSTRVLSCLAAQSHAEAMHLLILPLNFETGQGLTQSNGDLV